MNMAQQVIRIGPRGGHIVAEGTGGKGPQYEGHGEEHVGAARRPALDRPVQGSLFDAPRTLALKPSEEPRAPRATAGEQGDLFGGPPRTVALAGAGRAAPERTAAAPAPAKDQRKPWSDSSDRHVLDYAKNREADPAYVESAKREAAARQTEHGKRLAALSDDDLGHLEHLWKNGVKTPLDEVVGHFDPGGGLRGSAAAGKLSP